MNENINFVITFYVSQNNRKNVDISVTYFSSTGRA